MSAFERLLAPGCTELPACRCGKEMQIASLDQLPGRSDAYVRVYNCLPPREAARLGHRHSGSKANSVGGLTRALSRIMRWAAAQRPGSSS